MFVDLDWPLNASSLLSASAELLVYSSGMHETIFTTKWCFDCRGYISWIVSKRYWERKARLQGKVCPTEWLELNRQRGWQINVVRLQTRFAISGVYTGWTCCEPCTSELPACMWYAAGLATNATGAAGHWIASKLA